jgi:hypothetical protein
MKEEVCIAVPLYKQKLNPFEEVSYRRIFNIFQRYPIYGFMPRGFQWEPPSGTPAIRRIELDPRHFLNGETYSELLCNGGFYDAFAQYRYVLVHQLDCYVFRDELSEWCGKGYDYIGAPIFEGFFPEDPSKVASFVGNGGFSLRRVEAFQRVLRSRRTYRPQRPFWRGWSLKEPAKLVKRLLMAMGICNGVRSCTREHGEDIFWSRYARLFWPEFKVAPVREGYRFSWDYAPRYCHARNEGQLPFGCHSWERYDLEFFRQFIPISDEVAAYLTEDMKGPKPFRPVAMEPGGPLSAAHIRESARAITKRVLQSLRPGLEDQVFEQLAFNRLGRKPPELMWKACARCPRIRVEAGQAVIGDRLYVIGGYETMDAVLNVVDVFDLRRRRWMDPIEMPTGTAQTHSGVVSDDTRFIYVAGGQLGAQCSSGVAACRVLDAWNHTWAVLPPLPEPRYAPVLRLWRGRLHVVAGTCADRATPACEHWSIAVKEGRAIEEGWREEIPIPAGGTHRASAIINDMLYVFGGHAGDVKPVANDAQFTCDWSTVAETTLNESFMLEQGALQWKQIAPMPEGRGHTENAVVQIGPCAIVIGGVKSHYEYSDLIQMYDTRTDQWKIAGRLPYAMKTNAVFHDGCLYVITGQRTVSVEDPAPGVVLNSVWRAKFDADRI